MAKQALGTWILKSSCSRAISWSDEKWMVTHRGCEDFWFAYLQFAFWLFCLLWKVKCGGAGELNLMLDGCICPEPLEVGVSFTVERILRHKGSSGEERPFWQQWGQKCSSLFPLQKQEFSCWACAWAVVAQALPPHAKHSSIWWGCATLNFHRSIWFKPVQFKLLWKTADK